MKKSELTLGMLVNAGGYVVEVTAITADGVVVECPEIGEEIVAASYLKPLGRGGASDDYDDLADQYNINVRCQDAPCCGCCGF